MVDAFSVFIIIILHIAIYLKPCLIQYFKFQNNDIFDSVSGNGSETSYCPLRATPVVINNDLDNHLNIQWYTTDWLFAWSYSRSSIRQTNRTNNAITILRTEGK